MHGRNLVEIKITKIPEFKKWFTYVYFHAKNRHSLVKKRKFKFKPAKMEMMKFYLNL